MQATLAGCRSRTAPIAVISPVVNQASSFVEVPEIGGHTLEPPPNQSVQLNPVALSETPTRIVPYDRRSMTEESGYFRDFKRLDLPTEWWFESIEMKFR